MYKLSFFKGCTKNVFICKNRKIFAVSEQC